MSDSVRSTRMIAVGTLALLLFGFPIMTLFDVKLRVFGVPLLWAYLFVSWGAVIAIIAWCARDAE
ncbi:MAG: hypothetical protein QOE58_3283 [Actinomycetota bacterium]|nr:hypothetical protein [Actinomycetota bacterium]